MKRLLFITAFLPSIAFAQETYNPFESIGKTTEVVTLSNGRYKEVYGGDTVKRIGSVMFDVRTNKVVKFLAENDTTTGYEFKKEGDIATRWLSIDPLAAKYPSLSPYVFVNNNPIIFDDPDGQKPRVKIINNKEGNTTIKVINTMYVVSKGSEAKNNSIDPNQLTKYLRSSTVKLADKNISIEIEIQVVQVESKKDAIAKINENEGFGVLVKYDTRPLSSMLSPTKGISYYEPGSSSHSGYDELHLFETDPAVASHELAHDFGFADKYANVKGEQYSQCMESYAHGSIMGALQPISDYELALIAYDVLYNNSVLKTGRPIDEMKDRIPQGSKTNVVPFKNGKFDFNESKTVEVINSEGTPVAKPQDSK